MKYEDIARRCPPCPGPRPRGCQSSARRCVPAPQPRPPWTQTRAAPPLPWAPRCPRPWL